MEGTGSRHLVWKVLAWVVGTAIALGGVWLGILQYRSDQETQRAEASQASRSAEQQREEDARRLVGEVCARALDVFDSMASLTRSLNAGTAPERLDIAEFRAQLRDLTEAANRAGVPKLSPAASSVPPRFELLESYVDANAEPDPAVSQQVLEGVFDYMTIVSHCHQGGFPVPSVPPDLAAPASPTVTTPSRACAAGGGPQLPVGGDRVRTSPGSSQDPRLIAPACWSGTSSSASQVPW